MQKHIAATLIFAVALGAGGFGAAHAGENGATAYRKLLEARAGMGNKGSVAYSFTWNLDVTGGPGAADIRIATRDESKAIYDGDRTVQSSKVITETATGPWGSKTSEKEIYYKDGSYHMRNFSGEVGKNVKFPFPPAPIPDSPHVEGFAFMDFDETMIQSQVAHGNTLVFVIDPAQVNAYFRKVGRPQELVAGKAEAELDDEGGLKRLVGTGTYVEHGGSNMTVNYRGEIVVKENGGVRIVFPPELDDYREIAPPPDFEVENGGVL